METTATKCPVCGKECKSLTTASISYNFMFKYAGREGYYCANMCDNCLNEIEDVIEKFRIAQRRTEYNKLKSEFEKE